MFQNEKLENVFEEVIKLLDDGYSWNEIKNKLPTYREEIEKMRLIVLSIQKGNEISPAPEKLKKLFSEKDDVTEFQELRYYKNRQFFNKKGRLITTLNKWKLGDLNLTSMIKNNYLVFIGAMVIAVLVGGGVYLYKFSHNNVDSFYEKELSQSVQEIDNDVEELDKFANEKDLEGLDNDLAMIEQNSSVESNKSAGLSDIESLESELENDLDVFSQDIDELNNYVNDSSLDDLDNTLGDLVK